MTSAVVANVVAVVAPVDTLMLAAAPLTRTELVGVISVMLSIPVMAATIFALVDVVGRNDLTSSRKALYAAGVVFVAPVTLLYLLSRPTSVVRHRTDTVAGGSSGDWSRGLVTVLETPPGATPSMSSGEIRGMIERIDAVGRSAGHDPVVGTELLDRTGGPGVDTREP